MVRQRLLGLRASDALWRLHAVQHAPVIGVGMGVLIDWDEGRGMKEKPALAVRATPGRL